MDFEKLARRAQEIYVERGGADAARGDAQELEAIARGEGSLTEKAKRAAKALKQPGAAASQPAERKPTAAEPKPTAAEPKPTAAEESRG